MENDPKLEQNTMRTKIGIFLGAIWAYPKTWCMILAGKVCTGIFIWMVSKPWTGVREVVKLGVMNNTRANMVMFLRQNGIMHCRVCLSMKTLRRNVDGGYVCEHHYNPAQDLVKPA